MDKKIQIESLIDKAAQAHDSSDALRFSQAACNVANAMSVVRNEEAEGAKETK